MLDRVSRGPQRVRTLFLSEIHLGTRGCQAEKLLDFLRHYEAETIYLVGDIVDGWQLRSAWYWPQLHNDVVQKLLRQARKGVRLFSCATTTAPISAASRCSRMPSTWPPTASATSSFTATCST